MTLGVYVCVCVRRARLQCRISLGGAKVMLCIQCSLVIIIFCAHCSWFGFESSVQTVSINYGISWNYKPKGNRPSNNNNNNNNSRLYYICGQTATTHVDNLNTKNQLRHTRHLLFTCFYHSDTHAICGLSNTVGLLFVVWVTRYLMILAWSSISLQLHSIPVAYRRNLRLDETEPAIIIYRAVVVAKFIYASSSWIG